jgi:hypothetical protein
VFSVCPALFIKTRPATRVVSLRWDRDECLSSRRVRLRARFTRDCQTLVGTLVERPRRTFGRRAFRAVRTTPSPSGADPTFGNGGSEVSRSSYRRLP